MSFLELKNINFSYVKNKPLIENLSLRLSRGDSLAILGKSGSGKSTILRLISGFESPDSGKILLEEKDITYMPPQRRNIGYLFQDYALFPHLSVYKNIAFGVGKKDKDRVHELLEIIHMSDFKDVYPHTLSGGQQQRVALARALAPNPKLILLDEPFSALDTGLRSEIRSQIKEILNSLKISSILVTHDMEDVKEFATKTFEI
ncbi:iron(III) ABC transporter, ATP-binding protein [Campylobacter blaseri]|uniref:ABC transporter n=1 Tax=Campylobacter blaseri TaxID=2042961 RepID=A0A2P8QYK7_9BACT|nr:ABC transporter ATP-binding protein [Campylobacter blaseri]PSM51334.1 ABC transporter [Campylobacter blaseri]PSM52478.1 ABC transporter [Campylobacter blaseri]QKF86191.1 iron(III) ABC transporter, ATP-binding protein [Campylobacter blaseri]